MSLIIAAEKIIGTISLPTVVLFLNTMLEFSLHLRKKIFNLLKQFNGAPLMLLLVKLFIDRLGHYEHRLHMFTLKSLWYCCVRFDLHLCFKIVEADVPGKKEG